MASKEAVRPIYSELQGYLAQAPKISNSEKSTISNEDFWEQYNRTIQELNGVTGKNYSRYELMPLRGQLGLFIYNVTYCQKLGGLIAKLYGEYFSDEVAPFAEMPSTIITQSQNQNQSLQVQLLLEVNDLINKKLSSAKDGSNEKTFLEKIKASLSSVKDVSQLVSLLIITAHELNITIEQLKTLFS
ncbi:MAG: hypothetical protein ABSG82_08575 [Sedimentisphaerales bacterium]|jgi:hypothetical protein